MKIDLEELENNKEGVLTAPEDGLYMLSPGLLISNKLHGDKCEKCLSKRPEDHIMVEWKKQLFEGYYCCPYCKEFKTQKQKVSKNQ